MNSKELRVASFNADALSLDAVHFPEILELLPKMLNFRSAEHLPDLTVFKLQMDGEQLEKNRGYFSTGGIVSRMCSYCAGFRPVVQLPVARQRCCQAPSNLAGSKKEFRKN